MTVLKGQAELDQYCLTKKQIAKELGISTNAVRCRMRSGNKDNLEYRFDGVNTCSRDPVFLGSIDHPLSDHLEDGMKQIGRKKIGQK